MRRQIDTEVDVVFEYEGEQLKFVLVPITGSIEWGPAIYWVPSWSEVHLHIGMTPTEVQDWVVEMFEDDNRPVPPWAYTDGQAITYRMRETIESTIDEVI